MIDPAILAPDQVRPLRRDEYDRLVALGFFEDEKIELLAGMLVEMSPHGATHAYAVQKLTALFIRAIGERAIVRTQTPLGAGDDSESEPDLAIVPNRDYSHEHPTQALLVVEVAESSLRKDRLVKAAIYARAAIPEYWIVNLRERLVEVQRNPQIDRYASLTTHLPGEILRPAAFFDVEIPIADVLPTLG